jgi:hypothetical protein
VFPDGRIARTALAKLSSSVFVIVASMSFILPPGCKPAGDGLARARSV